MSNVADVWQQVMVHNPEVASRVIDGEAFIITPQDNQIHNLTTVGTRVWDLGRGGLTIGQIVEKIVEEYDAERGVVENDVLAFIRDLEERGIVSLENPEK